TSTDHSGSQQHAPGLSSATGQHTGDSVQVQWSLDGRTLKRDGEEVRKLGNKAAKLLRLLIEKRGTDDEFVTRTEVKSVYTGPTPPSTAIGNVRNALEEKELFPKGSWRIESGGDGVGWRLVGLWNVQVASGGAEVSVSAAAATVGQGVVAPAQAQWSLAGRELKRDGEEVLKLTENDASVLRLLIGRRGTADGIVTHAEIESAYEGISKPSTAIACVRRALKEADSFLKGSWEIEYDGREPGWRLVGLWNVQVEPGGAEASGSSAAAGQDVDAPVWADAPLGLLGAMDVDAVGDYGFNDEIGSDVGLAGGGLWGNWLPTAEGMSAAIGAGSVMYPPDGPDVLMQTTDIPQLGLDDGVWGSGASQYPVHDGFEPDMLAPPLSGPALPGDVQGSVQPPLRTESASDQPYASTSTQHSAGHLAFDAAAAPAAAGQDVDAPAQAQWSLDGRKLKRDGEKVCELGNKAASVLRLLIDKRGTADEIVTHAEIKSAYKGSSHPSMAIQVVRIALKQADSFLKGSWEIKYSGRGWRLVGLWNVQVESGGAEASGSSAAAAGQDVVAPVWADAPLGLLGAMDVDAVGDYGFNEGPALSGDVQRSVEPPLRTGSASEIHDGGDSQSAGGTASGFVQGRRSRLRE
ncbi:hypothetical protein ACLQ24_29465, partial [Micromonospora sp. DT4]|uniref:hypothetical protein n=1 Tax=Micromonospora sp. DT4 TaxID=3393438 RepID=UPI003CEF6A36